MNEAGVRAAPVFCQAQELAVHLASFAASFSADLLSTCTVPPWSVRSPPS
jgi:hypothetical protein